jgi:hypothetical protein
VSMVFDIATSMNFHSQFFGFLVKHTIKHFLTLECENRLSLICCPNYMVVESPVGHEDFFSLGSAGCPLQSASRKPCLSSWMSVETDSLVSPKGFHVLSRRL